MTSSLRERIRRPAFWWKWSAGLALLGGAVGLAPIQLYDDGCGAALYPTGALACQGKLDTRFTLCVVLLAAAVVPLAIGLALGKLTWWRAALCFVGVVGLVVGPLLALGALTRTLNEPGRYCNAVLFQEAHADLPGLRAQDDACAPFLSRQRRRALGAGLVTLVSTGAVVVALRVGRRPEPVPAFVPNRG